MTKIDCFTSSEMRLHLNSLSDYHIGELFGQVYPNSPDLMPLNFSYGVSLKIQECMPPLAADLPDMRNRIFPSVAEVTPYVLKLIYFRSQFTSAISQTMNVCCIKMTLQQVM